MKSKIPTSRLVALVLSIFALAVVSAWLFFGLSSFLMWCNVINTDYDQELSGLQYDLPPFVMQSVEKRGFSTIKKILDGEKPEIALKNSGVFTGIWQHSPDQNMVKAFLKETRSAIATFPENTAMLELGKVAFSANDEPFELNQEKFKSTLAVLKDRIKFNEENFCIKFLSMDKISNNSVIGLIIPKKVFFKEFVEPSLKILFSFPADLRVFDSKNAVVAEYKDFPGKAEKTFSYNLTGPFEDYKLEISANPSFIMLPSSFGIILAIIFFALIVLLPLAVIFYFYWHGRKTEDELSLKSNWILNLAHSIQGPVHSLKLLCEVFNENQSKKVSDLIFSELDSLDKKNRKFMKLASAGLVVEPVKIEEIKIGDLVKKQVENFSKQLKILDSKHKIELDVKVNSVIKTDIGKLEEVIEELLANALKFSPGQELIKVIVEKAAGDICIKILDNGLGISDAEQKKLFDPFYRVENSHNEGILGTGLGLFLAKKTIESCGGRLVLSSNGHKKGTSVSILLPENKT